MTEFGYGLGVNVTDTGSTTEVKENDEPEKIKVPANLVFEVPGIDLDEELDTFININETDTPSTTTVSKDKRADEVTALKGASQNYYKKIGYRSNSSTLFSPHFYQGKIGNCVGISTLQLIAGRDGGLGYLDQLVKKEGANNGYSVTFPSGKKFYIPQKSIDGYRAAKMDGVNDNDRIEAIIFALYADQGKFDLEKNMFIDSNGNYTANASEIGLDDFLTIGTLTGVIPDLIRPEPKNIVRLARQLDEGRGINIMTSFSESSGLPSNHAMQVTDIDVEAGFVTIQNPWDDVAQNRDGKYKNTIYLPIDDFLKSARGMYVFEQSVETDPSGSKYYKFSAPSDRADNSYLSEFTDEIQEHAADLAFMQSNGKQARQFVKENLSPYQAFFDNRLATFNEFETRFSDLAAQNPNPKLPDKFNTSYYTERLKNEGFTTIENEDGTTTYENAEGNFSYTFDKNGRLVESTENFLQKNYSYEENGLVRIRMNGRIHETQELYNENGALVAVCDYSNHSNRFRAELQIADESGELITAEQKEVKV